MKPIKPLLLLLLAMAVVACNKDSDKVTDSISVSPNESSINYYSQELTATVTGAKSWTLEGEYSWITPSATSGNEGDQVTFKIGFNTSGKARAAVFTFKSGDASMPYYVKQTAGTIEMVVSIAAIESLESSVSVNLNLVSKDIALFSKWGVAYSETTSVTDAKDVVMDGKPVEGDTKASIEGLEKGKTYNLWGWVADAVGNKIYSEKYVTLTTDPSNLNITPTVSALSRRAKITFDFNYAGFKAIGVCWSKSANPTTSASKVSLDNPQAGNLSLTLGSLEPSTKYYAKFYGIKTDGSTSYGAQFEFTTIANPVDNFTAGTSNCLTCYISDSGTRLASTTYQNQMETYIKNAFQAVYSLGYSFTRHIITKVDDQWYMFIYFYIDDSGATGVPKEANQYGGLAYKMKTNADGSWSFELAGGVHIKSTKWIVKQGIESADTFIKKLYNGDKINKVEFDKYVNFWTENSFYLDWTTPEKATADMYIKGHEEKLFNYYVWSDNIASNYDLTIYPLTIESGSLKVTGSGDNLLFLPGDTADYAWTISGVTDWTAELVKGGCIGTDPGTTPTFAVDKANNKVTFKFTAPAQTGKFRRQWTVKITSGKDAYYASIYESSNKPETTDNPTANNYAIHAYIFNESAIVEGTYELVPYTSNWRYCCTYNGQQSPVLAMWTDNIDKLGQGITGGTKLWRSLPQYAFDIKATGKGTYTIRPFGCALLGLGIKESALVISAEQKNYEWTIEKSTVAGWVIHSTDGYFAVKDIADNGTTMKAWVTFATTFTPTAGAHVQLYKLDATK